MKKTNRMLCAIMFFSAAAVPVSELQAQAVSSPMHGQGRRHGRGPGEPQSEQCRPGEMSRLQWFEQLKEENPEEYKRLTELREKDPEAFRQEMRTKLRSFVRERMSERAEPYLQKSRSLAEKYHAAEDPDEKEALKHEIESVVNKAFEARIQRQQEMLEQMEQRLEQLRERLAERKAHREEICAERVEELTTDPVKRW